MENPIKFKWLHLLCSLAVLVSLLTGFRVHLLNGYDTLFLLSPILPQGQLHNWHLLAGISIALLIPLYLIFGRTHADSRRSRAGRYHRNVHRLAYLFIPATLITGSMLWLGESDLTWRQWHFYSVLGLLIYILLHGYIYFLQLGKTLLSALFLVKCSL
ncbi:cytochrome b/b6 domain-containing protein [Shewanella woodyi]|uniref:cytochrome b/b6 domain-containing protein n=1 Tax=Shewanella woodyi TaxID=60961 RepID=UPI003747C055